MKLYMRKIQLIVGGATINQPLTIYFDVPFEDSTDLNITELKVYNLTDATINSIKEGDKVFLYAGYREDYGLIFTGKVKKHSTNFQGTDKITAISCIDDNGNYLTELVSKTYAPGTDGQTILTDLAGMSGLGLAQLKLPINFIYQSGKSIYSKLDAALIEVSKDCNAKVHVNRDKLYIRPKDEGDDIGFVLNQQTGLIDVPSPIQTETNDVQGKEKVVRDGYNVQSLLNHRITVDSILQISSKKVNGLFRVEKGKHICDGTAYYTDVEVYPL